jgi:alpha-tubulin suppressor-like RCC1 family protein
VEHTCALYANSSVKCWGGNTYGQLGQNNTHDVYSPAQVQPIPLGGMATYVFAGSYHTCAIVELAVRCWGRGTEGQLGTGRFNSSLIPDSPVTLTDIPVAGDAGLDTTCVLLVSGAVECWGGNSFGSSGLGASFGSVAAPPGNLEMFPMPTPSASPTRSIAPSPTLSPTPSAAPNPMAVVQVTGFYHTCVLFAFGQMKCWGLNDYGQLGYGHFDDKLSPPDVGYVDVGEPVVFIASGASHTCAVVASRRMKCWGSGFVGQLGYNNTDDVSTPAAVGYIDVGGNVSTVAAGTTHTCALLTDGTVKCWGDAFYGKLGLGCGSWLSGCICELPDGSLYSGTPAAFPALETGGPITQIAVAYDMTCLLHVNGTVLCFGNNLGGQMGIGTPGCPVGWNGVPSIPFPVLA